MYLFELEETETAENEWTRRAAESLRSNSQLLTEVERKPALTAYDHLEEM